MYKTSRSLILEGGQCPGYGPAPTTVFHAHVTRACSSWDLHFSNSLMMGQLHILQAPPARATHSGDKLRGYSPCWGTALICPVQVSAGPGPRGRAPPTAHPHTPQVCRDFMPFFCNFQKSILLVHHGSQGPAGVCPFLLQPGLREPLFSLLLLGLSCENSQISWGGSYPWRGGVVQRPGQNSVHLCSLPHNDPEQAPSPPITLFSPLPLCMGRSWHQALPFSTFMSNISDSLGLVLLPLATGITNQTLSK